MTVKELINLLKKLPQDATVTYRHNQHGRIDVDEVYASTEKMLFGQIKNFVTFKGKSEED